jgi:hypothetical protein
MASQFKSKLTQLLNYFYLQTMLDTVFDSFDWSEEDIESIKMIDKIYDFGVCEKIDF